MFFWMRLMLVTGLAYGAVFSAQGEEQVSENGLDDSVPVVISGDMIRGRVSHFLDEPTSWSEGVRGVLDQLEDVELIRKKTELEVHVHMAQDVDLSWKKPAESKRFELYRVRIPRDWSFRVSSREGQILAKGLSPVKIYAKIPVFSDLVTVDRVRVDLTRSLAVLWASAVHGQFRFSLGASWSEDSEPARLLVRWWESLRLNFPWPSTPHA